MAKPREAEQHPMCGELSILEHTEGGSEWWGMGREAPRLLWAGPKALAQSSRVNLMVLAMGKAYQGELNI